MSGTRLRDGDSWLDTHTGRSNRRVGGGWRLIPDIHDVRADLEVQIKYLERKYTFQEGREPNALYKLQYGQWLALKELLWRMDNPNFLGTVMS